ncbi:DUF559 domain-containing protein [[Actinomadura] parvosata]|uniref:DUF559 domain-containing protein n=1 Tax=[Actinomadura] parvosata TaxID=1955412 RepID=UPI00406D1578
MDRTALDCARWLPRTDAVAALDQFARRGVDLEALWHRPLNTWSLRETLSLADRGAASPRESWLRVILTDGGLPRPTTQIRVDLGEDRFAYLDLGWEEFKVAVEYDGQEHHTSPADQQHDADRREELRRRGWRVIAVRRDVIPGQIADLLQHVANALIESGWQPGPQRTIRILSRIRAARRSRRYRLPSRARCLRTVPAHGACARCLRPVSAPCPRAVPPSCALVPSDRLSRPCSRARLPLGRRQPRPAFPPLVIGPQRALNPHPHLSLNLRPHATLSPGAVSPRPRPPSVPQPALSPGALVRRSPLALSVHALDPRSPSVPRPALLPGAPVRRRQPTPSAHGLNAGPQRGSSAWVVRRGH